MMCLVTVRRLKPDSYDEFRAAWTPDPWPEKRQHKRRLVATEFAALAASRLRSGGVWKTFGRAITNAQGLARRTLESEAGTDPKLGELAARIEEAATLIGDVSAELSAYLAEVA